VRIVTVLASLSRWFSPLRGAERLLAKGRAAEAAGRLQEACGHYRDAISAAPGHSPAHLHLGVALEAAGDADGALASYEAALAAEPANPFASYNLGKALYVRGDLARAETLLRAVPSGHPAFADAQVVLAAAFERRGDGPGAVAALESALAQRPEYAGALHNLGMLHARLESWDAAAGVLARAATADPGNAGLQFWLGEALARLGKPLEAAERYAHALSLRPDLADAHVALGNLHAAAQRYAEALACYRAALDIDPRHTTARVNLGNAHVYLGEAEAARAAYDAALAIDAELAAARWARAMSRIPVIRDASSDLGAERAAFADELAQLDRWFDAHRSETGHAVVGVQQPFWLAYQDADNRELLGDYGRLCARLMGRWQEAAGLRPTRTRRPGPLRVGVVSQYFRHHSVWNALVKGWFQQLDRERFELQGFCLGAESDAETQLARSRAARFVQGPMPLRAWVEAILDAQPDVLIYPEVGMDPTTVKLASLRLAPLQAATWGHPETTGLPTVDCYFSAAALEPGAAQDSYVERLVALPNLGCYLEPSAIATVEVDPGRWGLTADQPLLLCPGTPFKYAPEHDRLYVEIARRLGPCQLCFFICGNTALSEKLRRRLQHAFTQAGLAFDRHVRFLPWLVPAEFYALMRHADAMLDTVGFSGFNTAQQALECALPVVAWEGRFLRGRLASGMLRHLGLDELVASDEAQYMELAVALAVDRERRTRLRQRIEAARPRLYRDTAPIRALEDFLAGYSSDSR
jgi:predicted O-linked N-acetylglucosamine transferase (SPINDLY family)